jgi:hypothetical protein
VPNVDRWADHALISYLQIIAEINRNKEIMACRADPRLTLDGKQSFKVPSHQHFLNIDSFIPSCTNAVLAGSVLVWGLIL